MSNLYHLYMDDSGSRYPDKKPGRMAEHARDYFALGGVLIKKDDKSKAEDLYNDFCTNWRIDFPLHSSEIRSRSDKFLFIGKLAEKDQAKFYEDLYLLMRDIPVIGIACVIDRPGYNFRYGEKYKGARWALCKTAFSVCVERAAKYAQSQGYRLKVYPEKCNKTEDKLLKSYYEDMRTNGMPFSAATSDKYAPLPPTALKYLLCEFKLKEKSSPLAQIADLYLWPICIGGYHPTNRPYARLLDDQKLIDCHITQDDRETIGIKYSCWEHVVKKTD